MTATVPYPPLQHDEELAPWKRRLATSRGLGDAPSFVLERPSVGATATPAASQIGFDASTLGAIERA